MKASLIRSAAPALNAFRARQMRFALTPSEEKLWRAICGQKLGTSFRRQVPLGRYIVDFLAPAERVVVEVDGGYHARRRRADERRDQALQRAGYRVLRLNAELVSKNLEQALALLRAALAER